MELKEGQLWTKDGYDFRVNYLIDGQVYGLLTHTKDRGNIDAESADYQFRRCDIEKFWGEKPELVEAE